MKAGDEMTKKQYIELFNALGNEAADDTMKSHERNCNAYYLGVAWAYANVINLLKNPELAETIYNKAVNNNGGEKHV